MTSKGLYRKSPTASGSRRAQSLSSHPPTAMKRQRVLYWGSDLTPVQRLVALAILDRMGKPYPDGEFRAYMSIYDIVERTGLSLRTVVRALECVCTSTSDPKFASADPIFELCFGGSTRSGNPHSYPEFRLLEDQQGGSHGSALWTQQPSPSTSTMGPAWPASTSAAGCSLSPNASSHACTSSAGSAAAAPPASSALPPVSSSLPIFAALGGLPAVEPPVAAAAPSSQPSLLTPEEAQERLRRYTAARLVIQEETNRDLESLKATPGKFGLPSLAYFELKSVSENVRYGSKPLTPISDPALLPLLQPVNDRLVAEGLTDTPQGEALAEVLRSLAAIAAPQPAGSL